MSAVEFWNNAASIYGESNMTKCNADHEMRCIIDATDAKDIRTLTCFGVADGSRDPSFVLRHLSEENKEMPKLFCNDFSPAMIDETKKLIGKEFPEIDVGYDVGSASKTDLTGWIKDTGIDENNTIMFIGLYDLDFLRKAMELYKENKERIGEEITLTVVDSRFNDHESVKIGYNDFTDIKLDTKHCYAVRFETETGFISHYFNREVVVDVAKRYLGTKNVRMIHNPDFPRYCILVVEKILYPGNNYNLVTCINNVLGNIPSTEHTDVFRNWRSSFFNKNSFLPKDPPTQKLNEMYDPWIRIVERLSELNKNDTIREEITSLPVLDIEKLGTTEEKRLAYLILTMLAQSYVWNKGCGDPMTSLPEVIATPLTAVASELGLKPILTHAGVDLWNWKLKDPDAPVVFENLEQIYSLTGTYDEATFFLVITEIEKIAEEFIKDTERIPIAITNENIEFVSRFLDTMIDAIAQMIATMKKTRKTCNPDVFYNVLRKYLGGWQNGILENGLIFEGTKKAHKCYGGSAAQSSTIPTIDIVLGIQHTSENTGNYLREMRNYMPGDDRIFLSDLEELYVGDILKSFVTDKPDLRQKYERAVSLLSVFRMVHRSLAYDYIVKMKNKVEEDIEDELAKKDDDVSAIKGTGGTDLMTFLTTSLEETSVKKSVW